MCRSCDHLAGDVPGQWMIVDHDAEGLVLAPEVQVVEAVECCCRHVVGLGEGMGGGEE